MTSRSDLALSDDGKWLAYLRFGPRDNPNSGQANSLELIEADTGKVAHSFKVDTSSQRMNALAFDAKDGDVLLARIEQDLSDRRAGRLVYRVERWSRIERRVTATVNLPLANTAPRNPFPPSGRLIFSPDRKGMLSVPAEPGTRATLWDLATANSLREFDGDFTPEAFFPDGRRIVGMLGSDIVVWDATTGAVTKKWPMPDGLVSVMGNLRSNPGPQVMFNPQSTHGYRLQPDAQSLWISPDGRWVAAFGQRPKTAPSINSWPSRCPRRSFSSTPSPGSSARESRFPTSRPTIMLPSGSRSTAGVRRRESPARGGHHQAGFPLFRTRGHTADFRRDAGVEHRPPDRLATLRGTKVFTMPTGLLFARGTNRLFTAAYPTDLNGSPVGDRSPASAGPRSSSKSSCPGT